MRPRNNRWGNLTQHLSSLASDEQARTAPSTVRKVNEAKNKGKKNIGDLGDFKEVRVVLVSREITTNLFFPTLRFCYSEFYQLQRIAV